MSTAQRAREILGAPTQMGIKFHELAYLLAQSRAVLALLDVRVFDFRLKLINSGFQRIEEGAQIRLVLLREALGFLFENLIGERLELIGERLLGIEEQRKLIL